MSQPYADGLASHVNVPLYNEAIYEWKTNQERVSFGHYSSRIQSFLFFKRLTLVVGSGYIEATHKGRVFEIIYSRRGGQFQHTLEYVYNFTLFPWIHKISFSEYT
jgi:hypothetical protein